MAWERRGKSGAYYYRSVRRDGRVTKRYLGKSTAAHQAAEEAAAARASRNLGARRIVCEQAKTAAALQLAEQAETWSASLLEAVLLGAGFWRPNYGPWRKRRGSSGSKPKVARGGEGGA